MHMHLSAHSRTPSALPAHRQLCERRLGTDLERLDGSKPEPKDQEKGAEEIAGWLDEVATVEADIERMRPHIASLQEEVCARLPALHCRWHPSGGLHGCEVSQL